MYLCAGYGARARALIEEIVGGFQALGDSLLEDAAPGLLDDFARAFGAEPATLWAELLHQLRLRLRSIGFKNVEEGRPQELALQKATKGLARLVEKRLTVNC